jgi:hypothetical protein
MCSRLDSTALGALLNVVVFGIKHLLSTAVYRGQLLIVNARPRITFTLRLTAGPSSLRAGVDAPADPSFVPPLPLHVVAPVEDRAQGAAQ